MLTASNGRVSIEEFSDAGDLGRGRRLLHAIRRKFGDWVNVQGPGHPGDPSRSFWDRMVEEGLVQSMDEGGSPITINEGGASNRTNLVESESMTLVRGITAYHVTMSYNLDDILREGLRIDQPSNEGGVMHGAVFFADAAQASALASQLEDIDEEPVFLEVYIPKGKTIHLDEMMPGGTSWYIEEPIPPRHIKVVDKPRHSP